MQDLGHVVATWGKHCVAHPQGLWMVPKAGHRLHSIILAQTDPGTLSTDGDRAGRGQGQTGAADRKGTRREFLSKDLCINIPEGLLNTG